MKHFRFLLIFYFCLACNQHHSTKISNSEKLGLDTVANTYSVESENVSMSFAIEKAKKKITQFDQALKSNNPSYSNFAIKKKYMTPDGGGEHMWITEISIANGLYKGVVNNDAEKTNEIKFGDTVFIRRDEITDWMYLENNTLKGGFTILEIRNEMNKEDRKKMDERLGFKIKD